MTREEASKWLELAVPVKAVTQEEFNTFIEAVNMAIKALEQEPCEDAISRQAVLEAIDVKAWEFCDYLISKNRNDEQKPVSHFADNLREFVREELPSVKPQDCHIYYHTGYQQALTDVRQEIYRHWHEEPCVVEHRCLDEIITIIDKCGGKQNG